MSQTWDQVLSIPDLIKTSHTAQEVMLSLPVFRWEGEARPAAKWKAGFEYRPPDTQFWVFLFGRCCAFPGPAFVGPVLVRGAALHGASCPSQPCLLSIQE